MKNKRVLFLETGVPSANGNCGGSFYSLYNLIKKTPEFNVQAFVLFYYHNNLINKFENVTQEVFVKPIFFQKISFRPLNTVIVLLRVIEKVIKICLIIKKEEISLIHCNDRVSTNYEGIIASRIMRTNCIVHQRQYNSRLPLFFSFFSKYIVNYIAISNSIKLNLHNIGIPKNKITVIHNWVDDQEIITERESIEKNFSTFKILWLGRLVPWKGIETVIELAKQFNLLYPHFKFTIDVCGDFDFNDSYHVSILEKLNRDKVNDKIKIKGHKKFNRKLANQYNLFLHTSINPEPFGRVIIEAMSLGLPVVSYGTGGVLDIIEDGKNGILIDKQDIEQGAQKIYKIAKNKNLLYYFTTEARKQLKMKFIYKSIEEKLKNIYNDRL